MIISLSLKATINQIDANIDVLKLTLLLYNIVCWWLSVVYGPQTETSDPAS